MRIADRAPRPATRPATLASQNHPIHALAGRLRTTPQPIQQGHQVFPTRLDARFRLPRYVRNLGPHQPRFPAQLHYGQSPDLGSQAPSPGRAGGTIDFPAEQGNRRRTNHQAKNPIPRLTREASYKAYRPNAIALGPAASSYLSHARDPRSLASRSDNAQGGVEIPGRLRLP